jgi:hypothetical protein
MKLKLNLSDRLLLGNFLPEKTGLKDLIIKNDILDKTKITQEDILKYQINETEKATTWNKDGVLAVFEIEFTELEILLLKSSIKDLAEKKELMMHHLNLAKQLINE